MFPLSDVSRRTLTIPAVTVGIIAINVIVFFFELGQGDAFVIAWSVKPVEIVAGQHWSTLITAMFMHGGFMHIIGNMVFLWVFGPEMEDAIGHVRYAVFYLSGGIVAWMVQIAADPTSTVPSLGASGAIVAVMGAFLVTYPRDRIRTVIFFGIFFRITVIPAVFLIGFWFLIQLISAGAAVGTTADQAGGVAYMAHVGGLIFGAVTGRLFYPWVARTAARQRPRDRSYL
jgi:membrane associated rhomboid family serine protease